LHKLLVAPRRKEAFKQARDIEIAVELLNLLFDRNDQPVLKEILNRFPASWRKTALKVLSGAGQETLHDRLAELGP